MYVRRRMGGQRGGENASFINSDVEKPLRIRFRLKSSNIIKFRLGFATAGKGVKKTHTPSPDVVYRQRHTCTLIIVCFLYK